MGPLSAVAVAFWLIFFGLVETAAITASPKVVGIIGIVAAVVVLVDTFWRWAADRRVA